MTRECDGSTHGAGGLLATIFCPHRVDHVIGRHETYLEERRRACLDVGCFDSEIRCLVSRSPLRYVILARRARCPDAPGYRVLARAILQGAVQAEHWWRPPIRACTPINKSNQPKSEGSARASLNCTLRSRNEGMDNTLTDQ
jgi:hypothetical protein